MKKLILLFLVCCNGFSQNINSLTALKDKLEKEIKIKSDSIQKIDLLINKIKFTQIKKHILDSALTGLTTGEAPLKSERFVLANVIKTYPKNTKVNILDYKDGNFSVCIDDNCGFMNELWILKDNKVSDFIKIKIIEENELKNNKEKQKDIKLQKETIALQEKFIKKYGKSTYNKLKEGFFWIGINKEMATIALGKPNDINKTVNQDNTSEQWVYDNTYLYFDNGILTSYQN